MSKNYPKDGQAGYFRAKCPKNESATAGPWRFVLIGGESW